MRFHKVFALFSLPLILLSCDNHDDHFLSIMQNTNIDVSSNEIIDYVHHTNSEEILFLLNNNEPFIFYAGLDSCSGCLLFKPNLIQYVKETKALIYYLNVGQSQDYEGYADIWFKYKNIFDADLAVPYLLFIKNQTTFKKGANSKMTSTNYQTFKTMMDNLVKVTPHRLYTTFDKIETLYNNSSNNLFIFYNRLEENNRLLFQNYLFPYLLKQQKEVEIVDLFNFSEGDKMSLLSLFVLSEEPLLSGYIVENQTIIHTYTFTENSVENDTFFALYF